ncbi:MAG: hypothetical protein FGM52_00040 [Mycobacterium sp.]|nr:hypothetical protein [Mycobacterium sp.]
MRTQTWGRLLLSQQEFGLSVEEATKLPWAVARVATVRQIASSVEIQIGPYAGQLYVRPGLTIQVEELVPGTVAACLELSHSGRRQDAQPGSGKPLVDPTLVVAQRFVDRCSRFLERGPLKEYLPHAEAVQRPRGRINIGATVGGPWARGRDSIIVCEWRRLTDDTPLNRILLAAAVRAERIINRHVGISRSARALLLILSGAELVPNPDSEIPPAAFNESSTEVLSLARTLISGVPWTSAGLPAGPVSCWINVERVFEEAVYAVCRKKSSGRPVYKGAGSGTKLFHALPGEPPPQFKSAEPDVVIEGLGGRLVLDAKYRRGLDDSQLYQLVAHAGAFEAHAAALIGPALDGSPSIRRLGRIASGCTIDVISVDPSSVRSIEAGISRWVDAASRRTEPDQRIS